MIAVVQSSPKARTSAAHQSFRILAVPVKSKIAIKGIWNRAAIRDLDDEVYL